MSKERFLIEFTSAFLKAVQRDFEIELIALALACWWLKRRATLKHRRAGH
jgi:hypothetical protein